MISYQIRHITVWIDRFVGPLWGDRKLWDFINYSNSVLHNCFNLPPNFYPAWLLHLPILWILPVTKGFYTHTFPCPTTISSLKNSFISKVSTSQDWFCEVLRLESCSTNFSGRLVPGVCSCVNAIAWCKM